MLKINKFKNMKIYLNNLIHIKNKHCNINNVIKKYNK